MQIVVHDNKMRKVALINNNYPDMLSFHSDSWHRYLLQATSTFDFTIPKLYNGRLHEDLGFINDKAYFSFKFQGKHHLFYVANITEDDFNITLNCNNTNLELVNEQANPFTSNSAQTIEWYLQRMELLLFANLEIGVNEIADGKRTLTFESQESKLSRLQSLMSRFDAEFEFVTELNNNGTLKRIVLNIYHEADGEHHGIGKVRGDVVLRYGNDVKGVQVTTDKTQLFNTGVFTGADGLSLKDVERSDKDANGNEEFYTRKGSPFVYAPLSMERYPASMKDGDNWTRKDFQTEYTNVNDLLAYAFRTIKQYAYPIVTYTASIQSNFLNDYQDLVLGDTVKIYDKNFVGGLILQARVTEQVISFSNPNNNTLTFSNYVKLDSKISDVLRNRMAKMIESRLPYTLKMSTSTGTSFKNGTGESIVTPELYKGQKKITDATYRYYFGSEMTTGQTYKVLASGIENKQVLTVAAYIGNDEVARDELTFVNVNDGQNGAKGEKGEPGPQGKDGNFKGTVGGRNYIRHYDFDGLLPFSVAGSEWTFERIQDPVAKSGWAMKATNVRGVDGGIYKYLFDLRGEQWQGKQMTWSIDIKSNRTDISLYNIGFEAGGNITSGYPLTDTWKRLVKPFTVKFDTYWAFVIYGYGWKPGDTIWIRDPQLEDGNIDTTPKAAPEDVNDIIASKADNGLTQEQINKLNEKTNLVEAETKAKASIKMLNEALEKYNRYITQNDKDKLQSEKDLVNLNQRLLANIKELKDMAERWSFLDKYFQVGNEGIVFGEKNGNTCTKMSNNRFSIFSAGNEVMYISEGTLFIENGIFSKAIQIGRFREEQHHSNPDMNVKRYVGGR
ncbi:phage tail protein [Streptococcus intermedius]|uniref:phage tail protein n=1 Tax=Streptococcus intermedius TaxID=1338 RepID=UPI003392F012